MHPKSILIIAGSAIAVFSSVPIGISWYLRNSNQEFITRAVSTTGKVIKLDADSVSRTEPNAITRPVVQYSYGKALSKDQSQDQSENQTELLTFTSPFGTYPPRYAVGETVEVLYDPNNPSDVRLRKDIGQTEDDFQQIGLVMIALGAIVAIAAILAFQDA